MAPEFYCTTFCNKPHRLRDGKPIKHECYVLPTEALEAERAGDMEKAQTIMHGWKKRRVHAGVRASKRRT